MASGIISALALELKNILKPSRRLEIIHALGLLFCSPSEHIDAPLILQILLDDFETEPAPFCIRVETLQAVARVSRHFHSLHAPRLINNLLEAWPKLFHWIWTHASLLNIPLIAVPAISRSDYFSAAINVLSMYSSHPALFHMFSENESTQKANLLVTRLWYWKLKGIDTSIPSSIVPLCRTYLTANHSVPDLQCFIVGSAVSMPSLFAWETEWMDIQKNTTNSAISSAIGLLLRTPEADFTAPSPDVSSIEAHLGMIVALSRAPRHTYAFINHHSSSVAAKALLSLSNLSASTSEMTVVAKCISLCVEHLCIMLEASAGFEPILEALDAMLLPVLVKCYGYIPQLTAFGATDHDAASLLSNVLSKYLNYISVRERVSKSLSIIAATGSEVLLVQSLPFAVAWSNFKALAVQRMEIQERPVRLKNEVLCSNITCRKTKNKADLACCSRCHVSFYCSKACQIYDWKHGDHRASCSNPCPDRKNFPIGSRDLRSVDEVVRHDLKLKLREIQAAWNVHRGAARAPVVVFDYTTNPPGFFTTTSDARRLPHGHSSNRQALFWTETVEMVDAARKRGLNQGIVVINVVAGAAPYSTTVPITLEELERTISSAGALFGPSATLCVG
ncbi:hypothetical protein B0H19DRAFT_1365516 [Mycena capillaripes]|nr:hypothetical protein B0H19DRAFT_1365516 [Mycena capillaripes]